VAQTSDRVEWIVDPDSPQSGYPGCSVLACVEGNGRLFAIIGGPPAQAPPQLNQVTIIMSSGEELWWRGQNESGDKTDELIIAKFNRPPTEVTYLDLNLDKDGTSALAVRLIRRP
jgi:hypothetical protein